MRLYVLRHADAEDLMTTDAARVLTPRGREQARAVGTFCQRQRLQPETILSSPYLRALQTAEGVAAALDLTPHTASFLASGMEVGTAMEELRAYLRFESVMIVGHQPDLGDLICALLGLPNAGAFPRGQGVVDLPGVGPGRRGQREPEIRATGQDDGLTR